MTEREHPPSCPLPADTDYILQFAQVARGFASWCEAESLGAEPEVTAAVWLAQLHAAALQLPNHEAQNDRGVPEIPVNLLARVCANLQCYLGRYYREFFDPSPLLDDTHVLGDIGDDLLDIYKDIRIGLILYDAGETDEALWHWSFLHRIHWGHHAVGALFALHCLSDTSRRKVTKP